MSAAKGNFKHFMQKEITEQPEAILDTIRGRALFAESRVDLEDIGLTREQVAGIKRVVLVGMGTSLHAAMVGRHYIERIAGIPAEVDNASEFRYREPLVGPETLVISVSAVRRDGRHAGGDGGGEAPTAARRSPSATSSAARPPASPTESLYTRCGLEIGVASTKTYVAAITALYLLACYLAQERGAVDRERMGGFLEPLARLPYLAGEVHSSEAAVRTTGARVLPLRQLPLPGPRHPVPGRDGGRAQAEGGQLHPRRGLPRRRDEARPDRPHRPRDAGHRHLSRGTTCATR